jgi:hypothetical protein
MKGQRPTIQEERLADTIDKLEEQSRQEGHSENERWTVRKHYSLLYLNLKKSKQSHEQDLKDGPPSLVKVV